MLNPETLTNTFLPATLKQYSSTGYLIEYYVINPATGVLTRKMIRVNKLFKRYSKKSDAIKHINKMIASINSKLFSGWNPFFDPETSRLYLPLSEVAEKFFQSKKNDLKPSTLKAYKHFINMFTAWSKKNNCTYSASMVNKLQALQFLEYLLQEHNVSNGTYNNHLKLGSAFFSWCKENLYTKQNPFESLKKKNVKTKTRIIVERKYREMITDYLEKNNLGMLLVINLIYVSLIRPGEIRYLKVEHLNIKEGYIFVPAEVAKNKKSRLAPINNDIINLLIKLHLPLATPSHYLIGKDFIINKAQAFDRQYTRYFSRQLKPKLKLPTEIQLYSFRDTGITEMLHKGLDPLTVQKIADHSSLKVTQKYIDHKDNQLIQRVAGRLPNLT